MNALFTCRSVRSGVALVSAMVLLVTLAAMAALVTELTVSRYRSQDARRSDVVLLVSAESAFNEAFAYFQSDPAAFLPKAPNNQSITYVETDELFTRTGATHNYHDVTVTVSLMEDLDPTKWGDEAYLVVATGTAGDRVTSPDRFRRCRVEGVIRPQPLTVFKQSMYAINGYDFMGSAMTDSYNSANAPYAEPPGQDWLNANGDIGSRGSINVENTGVHGTVQSGLSIPIPDVTYTAPSGAISVPAAAPGDSIINSYTFTGPGTYRTAKLVLGNGKILRMQGGGTITLYVDGAIDFQACEIQFDSKLTHLVIHQNDYPGTGNGISLNGNSDFGTIVPIAGGLSIGPSRPEQFVWISAYDGEMTLNGTASMNAVILAPYSTFRMNGTFDYDGAIIANAFGDATDQGKVNGNFHFHYDESLSTLSLDIIPRLQVAGWRTYCPTFNGD